MTTFGIATAVQRLFGAAALLVLASVPARSWDDTPLVRVEAMALLNGFNADLLSHPSATLTLERWCGDHGLAAEARIRAQLDRSVDKPASPEPRQRLRVGETERVAYRRVRLSCGEHVLSEADNWYVPSRLTPEMNRLLEETETPFGRAVLALGFHRELLSAKPLWEPLPSGWERQNALPAPAGQELRIPDQVLEHRAILLNRENVPFSEVVETYTNRLFAFPLPRQP